MFYFLVGKGIYELSNMKRFYETFSDLKIYPQLGVETDKLKNIIFSTPWGHIKYLLDRCDRNRNKIIFFMKKVQEFNWSRAVLLNFLINLHCYVVVEVKVKEFKSEMLGQLSTYVVAVDHLF